MAKTLALKSLMAKKFGTAKFTEADDYYRFVLNEEHILQGEKFACDNCAFQVCSRDDRTLEDALVTETFSYLKFHSLPLPVRFQNSTEMQEQIRLNDEGNQHLMEPGAYVLEPIKGARSTTYQTERRERIKTGKHIPKKAKAYTQRKNKKIKLRIF